MPENTLISPLFDITPNL